MLSNKTREKWIEYHVNGVTAVARKQVDDADTAIMQEQEDQTNAENGGLTTRKPEKTFEVMLNTIGDSHRDLVCSDHEDDGEDEEENEEDTELGKLSKDDEPGWVMGTISNMVQQSKESFRKMQMRLDEFMQPG